MKSIYESILSSTHTGKEAAIKNWLDSYFKEQKELNQRSGYSYSLTDDNKITNHQGEFYSQPLVFLINKEMPKTIGFDKKIGDLDIGDIIHSLKPEQMPKQVYFLSLFCKKVPKLTIGINSVIKFVECSELNTINIDFNRERYKTEESPYCISLFKCDFSPEEIKKLKVKTDGNIKITIFEGTLSKEIRKNIIKKLKTSEKEAKNYINYIFSDTKAGKINIESKNQWMLLTKNGFTGEWDIKYK